MRIRDHPAVLLTPQLTAPLQICRDMAIPNNYISNIKTNLISYRLCQG